MAETPTKRFTCFSFFASICVKMPKYIKCDGSKGSCLFVALRLGLECAVLLRRVAAKDPPPESALLDGLHPAAAEAAEDLRRMICKWYSGGLDKTIASFGNYSEANASQSSRLWTRQDVLAVEMVRLGQDVPESGPERTTQALQYIKDMQSGEWGSTPEYTAFAMLSKLEIQVYQPGKAKTEEPFDGLVCVNRIRPDPCMGLIRLLYNGHSHYDLLVDDETASKLFQMCPRAPLREYRAPRAFSE